MDVIERIEKQINDLVEMVGGQTSKIRKVYVDFEDLVKLVLLAKQGQRIQWVSVAERLPEEGILVLVFTINQTVETRRLLISPKYKWWEFKTSCFEFDWVTHWMSLPPAPKGEDDK
jgi:hypothetical protein